MKISKFLMVSVLVMLMSCNDTSEDNKTPSNNTAPSNDLDNDGVIDSLDAFPSDASEYQDTDNDGVGNNSDPDIDGDSVENLIDGDIDGDGIANYYDCQPENHEYAYNINANHICDNEEEPIEFVLTNKLQSGNGATLMGTGGYYSDVKLINDINGDGFDDVVISARDERIYIYDQESPEVPKLYVIYGHAEISLELANFSVLDLDGENGFEIINDVSNSISEFNSGDINNDGIEDLFLTDYRYENGKAFIILGKKEAWEPKVFLSEIDSFGVTIEGVNPNVPFGTSIVEIGDINNDTYNDLFIGGDKIGYSNPNTGEGFVIFGNENFDEPIDLTSLDGTNGFKIYTTKNNSKIGAGAAKIGDFNNDSIDDFALTSPSSSVSGSNAGEVYVVYGKSEFSNELQLNLMSIEDGFNIYGKAPKDYFGYTISGGQDFNNDGLSDILIGAGIYEDDGFTSKGEAYVLFGGTTVYTPTFDLIDLDGENGFTILSKGDLSIGSRVSGAGDFNSDGIDDILLGAPAINNNENPGEAIIIYGKNEFSSEFDATTMTATDGVKLKGITNSLNVGYTVSGGKDFNSDGVSDIVTYDGNNLVYLFFGFDLSK